jgi:hypothetical protein
LFRLIALNVCFSRRLLTSKRYKDTIGLLKVDAKLIKCQALILLGILLGATAVVNISLACFIAVIAVPVTIVISPTKNRFAIFRSYFVNFYLSSKLLTAFLVLYCLVIESS